LQNYFNYVNIIQKIKIKLGGIMKFKSTLLLLGAMVISGSPIYASEPEKKPTLMCPTADSVKAAVYSTTSYTEFESKTFEVEKQTFHVIDVSYEDVTKSLAENIGRIMKNPNETWREVTQLVSQITTPKLITLSDSTCIYFFQHSVSEGMSFRVTLMKS
jgi:hypothetical protein